MTTVSEATGDLKSHTVRDIPEEMWDDWKETIPRKYSPLGEAILELVAADSLCRQSDGRGAVQLLIEEGHIEREDVDALLEAADEDAGEDSS